MQYFWRNWQDMSSRSWRNYLGIYGATEIGVASQTSHNRNIPFIGKRNIWLESLVAWMRWINGMALERVGNKGHLSMEKKYAQVQSPTRCSRTKTAAKTRKTVKKKKLRKPGCHKPTPLRINLVLEIWLLKEPSQTYLPSETRCFSDFFLLHIVPTVASTIFEGV